MNSYTASNGVGLTITRDRTVRWRPGIPANLVSSALREYFQAERDEELGRWRDPEEPDYVAYPRPDLDDGDGRCVLVLDELSGATRTDWEQIALPGPADRYFTAHPLPEPEHEEIWVITANGDTGPALATTQTANGTLLDATEITAGRRIWPEPRIGGAE